MHLSPLRAAVAGFALLCLSLVSIASAEDAKPVRLFILSGQSNMAGLDPKISFVPAITEAFPDSDNVFVKSAQGGQPIRRWYKGWKGADGQLTPNNGDLYAKLLAEVKKATTDKSKPISVTFFWMQGESDAKGVDSAKQWKEAFEGVMDQLRTDLNQPQIGYVIGRISDFGDGDGKRAGWELIRKTQVELGEAGPTCAWVDTDDLNDKNGKNDLHYTKDGYKTLGTRFAEKAIAMIKQPAAQ